jgi:hypothetical protein
MFDTTHRPSPLTYSKNHTNTPHVPCSNVPCPSFIHVHTCPLPMPCVEMSHVQVSYMFIHIPCPCPMSKFHTCSYMSLFMRHVQMFHVPCKFHKCSYMSHAPCSSFIHVHTCPMFMPHIQIILKFLVFQMIQID